MHRSMTLLALSMGAALASSAMAQAPASAAKQGTFDQVVISGLGIRNIGSAAMSGRIAAVDAAHD
jgi:alpha-beta hydrolase superfamily lysophospholipase